ncbi:MAG TPA: hypothetical protein PLT93_21355 [Phycisphaerae bacterium]|nr:hypothetical protein [Phycisphaerae bacterium]
MTDKTIPEQLDAARHGKEFAEVLNRLFGSLEKAMDEEGDDE